MEFRDPLCGQAVSIVVGTVEKGVPPLYRDRGSGGMSK
jgi:hypothetical protein